MISFPRLLRQSPLLCYPGKPAASRKLRGRPRSSPDAFQSPNSLVDDLERVERETRLPNGFGPACRVNVVSEQLCDETLQFLEPSLEPYNGCEVLDLFPGAGLWSRKVNELVRPSKHTLIDAHEDGFGPFLSRLVDQGNRRFEVKSIDALDKRNRRREVYRDLSSYLRQTSHQNQMPLLILANLTRLPFLKQGKNGLLYSGKRAVNIDEAVPMDLSHAETFLHEFNRQVSGQSKALIRPFRLLIWMLDRDKYNFMPRSVTGRKSVANEVMEIFECQEIVGSSDFSRGLRRDHRSSKFEVRNAISVARRMRTSGIRVPEGRLPALYLEIMKQIEESKANKQSHPSQPIPLEQALSRLDELETRFALDKSSMEDYSIRNVPGLRTSDSELVKEMERLRSSFDEMIGFTSSEYISQSLNQDFVHERLLVDLERSITFQRPMSPFISAASSAPGGFIVQFSSDSTSTRPPIEIDLPTLTSLVATARLVRRRTRHFNTISAYVDNYAALSGPITLLPHDARSFEPLQPRPSEFYPHHNLALLSLVPRGTLPYIPNAPPDVELSRLPPMRRLRGLEGKPLPEALDRLAHGCAEALLPECTILRDSARGGRLDPQMLMVRMVTEDMWREIMAAWYRWPFRTSDEVLEMELGTSTVFRDFDNEG